jgi:flavin reductase (DIM6/NTAB) family NADH-FMN oxidoreductase RutF
MEFDVAQRPALEAYSLLTGLVVPRPIAWVTTISDAGVINLAPFSFFNLFGANPPVVVFSPTLKRDAGKKDTLKNIEAQGEFVIHAATERHAEWINASSKMLPHEESEVQWLGLPVVESTRVKPPRLKDSPFALECKLQQLIPVGNGPISANLVIGQVVYIHVSDEILDHQGLPDPKKLQSIARLGGEYWSRTRDLFEMQRPV